MEKLKITQLSQYILDKNWKDAFHLLEEELNKDSGSLETLVLLTEISRLSGNPKLGIEYGRRAIVKLDTSYTADQIIAVFYTLTDFIETMARCYYNIDDFIGTKKFIEEASVFSFNPTPSIIYMMIQCTRNSLGLDFLEQVDRKYDNPNIILSPIAYVTLKIELARVYYAETIQYIEVIDNIIKIKKLPIELLQKISVYIKKVFAYMEKIPEEYRSEQDYQDLFKNSKIMLWEVAKSLYIGNGDYNKPEILINSNYTGDRDCFECFILLDKLGELLSYSYLGILYRFGLGTERDEDKSNKYINSSIESGSKEPFNYALIAESYYHGLGTKKDFKKAFEFADIAAKSGNATGQKVLGLMYFYGEEVGKDEDIALKFFKLAATQGDNWSKQFLIELAGDNISDYNSKLQYITELHNIISQDPSFNSNPMIIGKAQNYVRVFHELERYLPFGFKEFKIFIILCMDVTPESLFKSRGIISADYFNKIFDYHTSELYKMDKTTFNLFFEIIDNYNYASNVIQEYAECLDKGLDVDTSELNWALIEKHIKEFMRDISVYDNNKISNEVSAEVSVPYKSKNVTESLMKGQKVNLVNDNQNLNNILIELAWEIDSKSSISMALVPSILIGVEKRELGEDRVSFLDSSESDNNFVTSEGKCNYKRRKIIFSKMPNDIERLVFTLNIDESELMKQNFSTVKNIGIRIIDEDSSIELIRYNISDVFSVETSLILGELYKYKNIWKFNAIGSGFRNGFSAILNHYRSEYEKKGLNFQKDVL